MTAPERHGIVFDVDDTLYLERDYVRSGFRAVSRHAAAGGEVSADEVFEFLHGCFERGERGNTFDLLLEQKPALRARLEVRDLVETYRAHAPEIDFLPGMRDLLDDLRARGVRLAVISDGALESQRQKVAALGLEQLVDHVVLTDRWGRDYWKPHPRAFEHLATEWSLPSDRLAYVGDNPDKDFLAPNRLGWWTVRLRLAGQLRAGRDAPTEQHVARMTVTSVRQLDDALRLSA